MTDILDFQTVDEPVELQITSPIDGKPLNGSRVWLYGPDTKQYRTAQSKLSKRARAAVMKGGKRALLEDDDESSGLTVISHCVVRWEGLTLEGEQLEPSPENAARLFGHPKATWLRDQVAEFLQDRVNFLPRSEES